MGTIVDTSKVTQMAATFRSSCCIFRHSLRFNLFKVTNVATYKSKYNVQHVYPNSNLDVLTPPVTEQTQSECKFSGHIPVNKLDITYMRSSGPGGQNVNKVNTKVEIRFHVESADWLPQTSRDNILEAYKTRVTRDGYLILCSDKTRKQILNQADCVQRLREMIWEADKKPAEPSEEDLRIVAARQEKARKNMLKQKREHSLKKQSRQCTEKVSMM